VIGEDDTPATVELDEEIIDCPSGDAECPIDEEGDGTGGNSTDGDGNTSGDDTGNDSASLAAPVVAGRDHARRGERLTPTMTGLRDWVTLYLKGIAMGSADAVPGVSGGTIALILGIYERLIAAVTAIDPDRIVRVLSGARPRIFPTRAPRSTRSTAPSWSCCSPGSAPRSSSCSAASTTS